jgi:hypothetical protein
MAHQSLKIAQDIWDRRVGRCQLDKFVRTGERTELTGYDTRDLNMCKYRVLFKKKDRLTTNKINHVRITLDKGDGQTWAQLPLFVDKSVVR